MEPSAEERPRRWDRRRAVAAAASAAVVLGVIALLVVGLANRGVGTSIQDALAEGERPDAPSFRLPVLAAGDGVGPAGTEISLEDLRGRTVILNFWASWCKPCETEAPVLEEIARRYRDRGDVLVLGVDIEDLRGDALAFLRRHRITYPSLRDPTDATKRAYELTGVPETFVIDPQGRVALKRVGEVRTAEELTTAVEQL